MRISLLLRASSLVAAPVLSLASQEPSPSVAPSGRRVVPCMGQPIAQVTIYTEAPSVASLRRVPVVARVARTMHETTQPNARRAVPAVQGGGPLRGAPPSGVGAHSPRAAVHRRRRRLHRDERRRHGRRRDTDDRRDRRRVRRQRARALAEHLGRPVRERESRGPGRLRVRRVAHRRRIPRRLRGTADRQPVPRAGARRRRRRRAQSRSADPGGCTLDARSSPTCSASRGGRAPESRPG